MEDAFAFIGQLFGHLIRFIVDGLGGAFANLDEAASGFMTGLSDTLGIAPSLLGLGVLAIGLWLLWRSLRALIQRAILAALIWALLGVTVLGWLIN